MYRAGQAMILGDVAGTVAHARRALELVGEEDHLGRGAAAAFLGLAYWTGGDLDAAQRWYADCMASLQKAGYLSDVLGGAITLADIRVTQGRLARGNAHLRAGIADRDRTCRARAEGNGGHARGHEPRSTVSAMTLMPPRSTC